MLFVPTTASTPSTAVHLKGWCSRKRWSRGRYRICPAQSSRPPPKVDTIAQLNEYIAKCDIEDMDRVIDTKTSVIASDFAIEVGYLQELPTEHFDITCSSKPRVDAKSRVVVRQCFYLVPVSLIAKRVDVSLGAERVVISFQGRMVACHERLVHRGEQSLILDHYLEALIRKPGALPGSVPLAQI